jgi:TRAP-type C4-dicarboxylate transport system permease small subunit
MTLAGVADLLERAVVKVEPPVRVAAGLGVLALMLLTVVDITVRTAAGAGVAGVIEITEVTLVVAVYLGMMTAGRDGHHIRVGLLTDRLPLEAARVLRIIGLATALVIVGWLIWTTGAKALISIETHEFRFGLISVPIWPARLAIPIGLLGLFLVLLQQVLAQIARRETTLGREQQPFEELLESPED